MVWQDLLRICRESAPRKEGERDGGKGAAKQRAVGSEVALRDIGLCLASGVCLWLRACGSARVVGPAACVDARWMHYGCTMDARWMACTICNGWTALNPMDARH